MTTIPAGTSRHGCPVLIRRTLCCLCLLLAGHRALAVEPMVFQEESVEASYAYAALLGSGSYNIDGRQISMFRLPFSWAGREASETEVGWRLLLSTVVGYDDLGDLDLDSLENLRPDELVTLTAMPGIELTYQVSPTWQLKPFVQVGGGRDFSTDETLVLAHVGLRSLTIFEPKPGWQLRWGNAVNWASEDQREFGDRQNFVMLETGLDLRRNTPWKLMGRSLDIGAYYVLRYFDRRWRLLQTPEDDVSAIRLYEIGLSSGLRRPVEFLGISFQRVRMGYVYGGPVQGWTIGTEFPF